MGLHADTVDGDALRLQALDQVLVCGRLGTRTLDVVVVDVQLREGIGGARSTECDGDVFFSQGVVEDVAAESTIIVERLCAAERESALRSGNLV